MKPRESNARVKLAFDYRDSDERFLPSVDCPGKFAVALKGPFKCGSELRRIHKKQGCFDLMYASYLWDCFY